MLCKEKVREVLGERAAHVISFNEHGCSFSTSSSENEAAFVCRRVGWGCRGGAHRASYVGSPPPLRQREQKTNVISDVCL